MHVPGKLGKWENRKMRNWKIHLSLWEIPPILALFHFCVHILFLFFSLCGKHPLLPPLYSSNFSPETHSRKLRRYLIFLFLCTYPLPLFSFLCGTHPPPGTYKFFGHSTLPHNTHHRFGIFSRLTLCDVWQVLTVTVDRRKLRIPKKQKQPLDKRWIRIAPRINK